MLSDLFCEHLVVVATEAVVGAEHGNQMLERVVLAQIDTAGSVSEGSKALKYGLVIGLN